MDDAKLQTIWQQRQFFRNPSALAEPIALLMKRTLGKKVKQLSRLSEIWDEVVPEQIARHTALESFNRGVLTVTVDSSTHRFQLQSLINGGLGKLIQQQFGGAINRIKLLPGQFYSIDVAGTPRYEF